MENKELVVKQNNNGAVANVKPADIVINQFGDLIAKGQLEFPKNYNYVSAVKYAALVISQTKSLCDCTKSSIAQALSDMALQGLDVSRKHGYFIKFGNELKFFRSYFGDVAAIMQSGFVKDIKALVVYEGDTFETGIVNDEEVVLCHQTSFANKNNPIIGAYAVAILTGGIKRYCIMTKKEIDKSWAKSTNAEKNTTQRDFPQEMAKRTVIRRLVKMLFNSSNTSSNFADSLVGAFNRTTENEFIENNENSQVKRNVKTNIEVPNIIDSEEYIDEDTEEEQAHEELVNNNGEITEEDNG